MRRVVLILLAVAAVIAWRGIGAMGLAPGMALGGMYFWALVAVFELPLLGLLWRQVARPGTKTMALTAAVSFVGLLPITGVVTIFSGFAMEVKQLYWLFHLWALLAALLLAGALAVVDYRRGRNPAEPASWMALAGASALYVVVAHGIVAAAADFEIGSRNYAQTNQYQVKDALRHINRCASEAAARPGAKGYPETLAALGPQGTGCLDSPLSGEGLRAMPWNICRAFPMRAGASSCTRLARCPRTIRAEAA
jgi:hypothetical protein